MPQNDPLAGRVVGAMPIAERVIDGETYVVQLDLTPLMGTILTDVARALWRSRKTWALRGLGMARPESREATTFLQEALTVANLRDAFLIQLGPADVEALYADLDEAAMEPERCRQCDNYATTRDGNCPAHDPEGWDGVAP